MSAIEFHQAAIAFHQSEIAKLSGNPFPTGFDQSDWRTWWPAMQAQYQAEDANVASEREIGEIVTKYATVINAAQRERWPTPQGTYWVGNYKTASDLRASIRALMQTEEYKAWAAHPLNAHLVPKAAP